MEYLFLLYADAQRLAQSTPEQIADAMDAHQALRHNAEARGIFKSASRLEPPSRGFTVRSSGSGTTVTDGPYAETREVLGGYYLMDCSDSADAAQWAERLARIGSITAVEVRGLVALPERVMTRRV